MNIIKVDKLVKLFGDNMAVNNLSFNVKEGEILGLLGPNGAGKSTAINVITGILKANSGEVILFDDKYKNKDEIKRNMGIVPQSLALYDLLTAEENIRLFASLYGLRGKELNKGIDDALEFTGLLDKRKELAKNFSGGMLRRLNIACAIAHKPKLLIMDEPTVGIDPQSRDHILKSVKKLNSEGITIVYTSHYMEEVEAICSRVVIMDLGKVIAEGTKEELISMITDVKNLDITLDNINAVNIKEIEKIKGVKSIIKNENSLSITSLKEINNLNEIINYIMSTDTNIVDIDFKQVNLETVFLSLTGRKIRD